MEAQVGRNCTAQAHHGNIRRKILAIGAVQKWHRLPWEVGRLSCTCGLKTGGSSTGCAAVASCIKPRDDHQSPFQLPSNSLILYGLGIWERRRTRKHYNSSVSPKFLLGADVWKNNLHHKDSLMYVMPTALNYDLLMILNLFLFSHPSFDILLWILLLLFS